MTDQCHTLTCRIRLSATCLPNMTFTPMPALSIHITLSSSTSPRWLPMSTGPFCVGGGITTLSCRAQHKSSIRLTRFLYYISSCHAEIFFYIAILVEHLAKGTNVYYLKCLATSATFNAYILPIIVIIKQFFYILQWKSLFLSFIFFFFFTL
jgi:hypothetical protein